MRASIIIDKFLRAWLISVPFYVLFQYRIVQVFKTLDLKIDLITFLNRIDEITIIVFLPAAAIRLLSNKEHRSYLIILSIPVAGLVLSGILSGFINSNPLKITLLGTFSYVKFFLLIFIYAAFFIRRMDFMRLYRPFLVMSIILVVFAFLQEAWAIYSRYVLGISVSNPDTYLISYLLNRAGIPGIEEIGNWRWYIYRTPSLLSHYNLFGLFCLFILCIYLFSQNKKSCSMVFLLICGVLLSVSRVAYIGLLFVMLVRIFNKKRAYIALSILFVLSTLIISLKAERGIPDSDMQKRGSYLVRQNKISFREYAEFTALQVWKDYPLLGAGPGMFGGDVAYKYNSPLYEEYNFFEVYRTIYTLDRLWPQLFAEMGIMGGVIFIELIITVFILLLLKKRKDTSQLNFYKGLGVFTVVFFFYTFGGNLNNPALLYPYCAFLGIALWSGPEGP